MNSFCTRYALSLLPLFVFLYAFSLESIVEAVKTTKLLPRPFNNSISAAFVFGDSTVDPGNNDYILTAFKSNFPPYGKDFANHTPTGRFTNGRLVTDFIASYVGVKQYVPAYLDPTLTLEDLMTGVSFASASSGYDPVTAAISSVIPIQKQLEYFTEYKRRLEMAVGKEKTEKLISKAAFVISAGTNDFGINYFGTPFRRLEYPTVSSYQNFLLQKVDQVTQSLRDQGARLIAFVGLPPMGCLPAIITLHLDAALRHRQCVESLSNVGRDYNQKLQEKLKAMQKNYGIKLVYADIYTPLDHMIKEPSKFGFTHTNRGCCGTGLIEGAYSCNPATHVCSDPSEYVFWDAIHPTEKTYYFLFKALRPIIDDVIKDPKTLQPWHEECFSPLHGMENS